MNVLAFTFEAPSRIYGGGLGVIQSLTSLSSFSDVTYVGPAFSLDEFPNIKIKRHFFLHENKNVVHKAYNIMIGVTSRYYQSWKKVVEQLNPKEYDYVYIDFSYNDFIVKWSKKNNIKTIVRVHNIEQDMAYQAAHGNKHDRYWFRSSLNYKKIVNREHNCLLNCDALIFLTEQDKARAIEIYGNQIVDKAHIIPVCVDHLGIYQDGHYAIRKKYLLATGSLYYGPNSDGIRWLVEHVWPIVCESDRCFEYKLVIAGRNPTKELKEAIKTSDRCELVESPEDMSRYFLGADLYLAPIFTGAGMKVKVAEALSYGLCVVGTSHSLIGYENAFNAVLCANSAKEFADCIFDALFYRRVSKQQVLDIYERNFSIQNSSRALNRIFNELHD